MDGALIRTTAAVCPKCGTAYLSNFKKEQLEQKIKKKFEIETAIGSVKSSSSNSGMDSTLNAIPDVPSDSAAVFAHRVYFLGKIPSVCMQDNQKLAPHKHIVLDIDGSIIETQGRYCSQCNSAYFLRYRQYEFQDQIQKWDTQKADSEDTKTKAKEELIFTKIPFADSSKPKCSFCKRALKGSTVIKCRLEDKKGEEVLLPLAMQKCNECGSTYLNHAVLSELQHFNLTPRLVNPTKYRSPSEMLKDITLNDQPAPLVKNPTTPISKDSSSSTTTIVSEPAAPIAPTVTESTKSDCSTSDHSITYEIEQIPILNSNRTSCPYCGKTLQNKCHAKYPAVKFDGKVISKYAVLWECQSCNALYADNQQLFDLRRWNDNTSFKTISVQDYNSPKNLMRAANCHIPGKLLTEEDMPFKYWGKESENLSSGSKIIQVYASRCHCQKCRNKYDTDTMVNRTAIVETIKGSNVKINVMYCRGCGQYFVSLAVLEQYKNLYGGLLMECRTSSDIDPDKLNWFHFAPDTVLSRCGYTVKSGVDVQYRHTILAYILDSGKAQKYDIIEKINGFIRIRENQPRYSDACQRWREDIQFVSNYRINQQRMIHGLKFQKGY